MPVPCPPAGWRAPCQGPLWARSLRRAALALGCWGTEGHTQPCSVTLGTSMVGATRPNGETRGDAQGRVRHHQASRSVHQSSAGTSSDGKKPKACKDESFHGKFNSPWDVDFFDLEDQVLLRAGISKKPSHCPGASAWVRGRHLVLVTLQKLMVKGTKGLCSLLEKACKYQPRKSFPSLFRAGSPEALSPQCHTVRAAFPHHTCSHYPCQRVALIPKLEWVGSQFYLTWDGVFYASVSMYVYVCPCTMCSALEKT